MPRSVLSLSHPGASSAPGPDLDDEILDSEVMPQWDETSEDLGRRATTFDRGEGESLEAEGGWQQTSRWCPQSFLGVFTLLSSLSLGSDLELAFNPKTTMAKVMRWHSLDSIIFCRVLLPAALF